MSHFRKEGLSVLTSFLLFLEFLLGKKNSFVWVFFFFVLVQQMLFLQFRDEEYV